MPESSKRSQRELRRVKNAVRGAFNRPKAPYLELNVNWGRAKLSTPDLILGGFSHLGADEAQQFVQWLKGFPSKAVQIYPVRPVRKAADLAIEAATIPLPLLARLNWLSTLLETSNERLAAFIAQVERYERAYLMAQYEEAQAVLDEIATQAGQSVWLIENQIALLQRWKGLDAQKEYTRSISGTARGRVAGVSTHWVSQRNEASTVFNRFRTRLERSIEAWSVSEPLKDAYAIILGIATFGSLSDTRASLALGSLASVSLLDAYTYTLLALESVVSAGHWSANVPVLASIVDRLPKQDIRVRNLSALLSGTFSTLPLAATGPLDRLSGSGTSTLSVRTAEHDAATLLDCALVSAAGDAVQDSAWPADSPLGDLYHLVATATLREEGFEIGIDRGGKLLANIKHLPISSAVRGLIAAQDPKYLVGTPSPAVQFFINSRALHPWHAHVLPRTLGLQICTQQFADSPAARLIGRALADTLQPQDAGCTPLKEFAARVRLAEGRVEQALDYLRPDDVSCDAFARRRLAPLQIAANLRLGRVAEAVASTAWACAVDSDLAFLLPLQELTDEARASKPDDPLSLAITYDLYLERYDDADVFQLMQFAYEDYILKQGVKRPSELSTDGPGLEMAKLVYFLRGIAVPEVMDVSFWLFKTSRETFAERIAVCSLLTKLDPAREGDYRDEIKDLTRLLSIQDGLDDVDRSRVFVNLPKLQRWAEIELRESFERYKALQRAGAKVDTPGDFDKTLKDFAAGKATLDRFANYPDDEAGQLLLDIYKSIAEKYLHDPDFGLDAYLSMRIRHGSLAGHIRGPLEEPGLLAVRDHGTNQYRMLRRPAVGDHWADVGDWEIVRERVEDFSRSFDSEIDSLVKTKLQINGPNKPEGLFRFDPSPFIIYYLRANIDEGSTFVEFLDKVIDALNIYLNVSLHNVSVFIRQQFGDAIDKLLDQFRAAVDEGINLQLGAELRQLLAKASPELQASIERVASWFALDPENQRRTLRTMQQIVDIAIQATNNAHRGVEPSYDLDIEDLGLQSNETLLELTDILFTILDNIYTHSGLDQKPMIKIHIGKCEDSEPERTRVRILVTNQVASHKKSLANERRLERIREQIQTGDYRPLSKVEGGTGLLKLKRIVAADNRQTLDFGYRPEALEFFVEITMILFFEPQNPGLDAAA